MNKKSLALVWWCVFLSVGILFYIPFFGTNLGSPNQNNSGTLSSESASWKISLKNHYYTSKNSTVNEERQLNAKLILETSQQWGFPLNSSQGLQWGEEIPEETIDRVATLITDIQGMRKKQAYTYQSLEEYLLLFAAENVFTGTGKQEDFDEKKICMLPLKDAEAFILIRDQFLSNADYADKEKEAISQKIKEQLSFGCKYLNIETQTGTLEDYVKLSLQKGTPLDPTEIQKYPMGISSTDYFVEKMYIFGAPLKQSSILVNEWVRRRQENGNKPIFGEYRTIQAMHTPQWKEREYRMKVILDQLITGSAVLKNANSETKNEDPTLAAIAKKAVNLFEKLAQFEEKEVSAYTKRGEDIDGACEKLNNPTIRTCIGNKMVLSYLYLYEQQYSKALAILKTAEDFPLMNPQKMTTTSPTKDMRWDVYKATSLWPVQARAYFEQGDYATAQTYLLKDVKNRPLGRNNLELKMNMEALAGKFEVPFTISK